MADRRDFRSDRLEDFWRFVAERQRVWYRRVVRGSEPPWTDDAVLRRHRFTNVYRLLDPGTQYAIRRILARDAPAPDRLFNVLLYRLVGRAETHAAVGFQRVDGFDVDAFEGALRVRGERGPVFTGAYTVSGYGWTGGDDKVENVARLLADVRDGFRGFTEAVEAATGPEAVYSAVRDLPGFGNFLAYQVLADLLYPVPDLDGEPLLPHSPNEWAAAGPGARQGLDVLLDGSADVAELEAMRWLCRNQADEFDRIGVDFECLRAEGGDPVDLSLSDVQNCCCEFFKHHKVRTGEGRTRRRFRLADRRPELELRGMYDDYGLSTAAADYAGDVEREGRRG